MAFKFDDSYIGAARAFGKKAREAKAAGDNDQAQAMMANKASSAIGGALTAVNGVTGILNTALQSANIQDTSQYEGQIDLLSQAGNRNYYDYGQLAEDMSNTDFSVNTDYDAIRGMGGKGVTKEKIGAVGSSTLNGAMTGLQVGGPWGAAIGAVVGAGSAIGGILAGDQKARIQQGFLDANADRATTDAMLNFNAGLEEIGNRRNRFNLANYAAKGGKIEIKKENEGKFTAAAKRHNMTVQEFAKHVLAKKNADKYSATMRKRANFARNAAGWKHAEGGPIDYSGITTTNNRPYNTDYISYIDTALRNGGLNNYQRAAVLANIIEESGGNPFAEGPGGFYGLLQWSGARYPKTQEKDIYKEIDNQVANILSTAKNSTDKMSWTHGGKGSGYNSLTDAMKAYNGENLADVMKGYTLGYVRPAAGINAYNNRLKVAEQLYNLKGFTQHAEGGELNTSNMNTYNTHGGYFNPGLISIDAGGTHEQNPNGGVQLGVDSQGIPNLVEEGETVYDDYVFSDRLKPSASELKKFNLPDKFAGKTFAELSDVLGEEAKERPNDAISNSGLGVMLDRLIACQEAHKQAQEERELRRELSKLSPEELVALGSQLQQMSDQQAMAQQGMPQYMPQMEAPMMQQMPADDQSQLMAEQQPMMATGGLLRVYKDGTDDKDNSDTEIGYPQFNYGFNLPAPLSGYKVYRSYPNYLPDNLNWTVNTPSFTSSFRPSFDYGAGLVPNNPYGIGMSNYKVYRDWTTRGSATDAPEAPVTESDSSVAGGNAATGTGTTSPTSGRPSLGLPEVEPITLEAVDTLGRLRRRRFGLEASPGIQVGGAVAASGTQPGETPSVIDLAEVQSGDTNAGNSTPLLPTMGRYAGAAGNVLSALDIALQSPDRVSWNRIQPNYVAGNLDLQKMRYTPIDWQIGANQVNANAAATRRAISNAGMGPAVGATLLAANYGNNQNLGNVINQTQLANDQRRAQTIGVNNQAENLMRNFDFRRNAMNTQIANQFAQYNNQLDMDETLRNIQFENDKYAALSHAISNSLNDISNIGRENFAMNQINSNAALYYGVGANGWAYYKGYDGVDWKVDPQSGRRVPVTDKSEIPAAQQKHGGMLKKYKGC